MSRWLVRTLAVLGAVLALAGPVAADGGPGTGSKPAGSGDQDNGESLFSKIAVVEAASLHTQTLEDAPASVTVISAEEIRKYGYRTLGEALGAVRGFYFTNDRMYDYSGIRGLAIPGDYNSRFLVMLNSHPLTENIYNSNNFFGQDFGLDMDMVERIEIIRGPSSALFGSNGMLATINVITLAPVDHPQFRVSMEAGSFGEKKAIVSSSFDLGKGANLLISMSMFNNGGRSLYFPEFDRPETRGGVADNVDAQKGYHTLAQLTWGRWSFTGYFNSRDIRVPVGGGSTIFGSQGGHARDQRDFAGVNYTRDVGKTGQLRWQFSYDRYRYNDRWDYSLEDGEVEDNRTYNWGDWLSSQLTYIRPVRKLGDLTLGVQGTFEMRNLQINEDVSPVRARYLDVSAPDRAGALFAQQEWFLSRHLKAYLGLRLDSSRNYGNHIAPRLALVYQPSDKTSYKLVYGRPFRNPSAFERYYDDNGLYYAANPGLRSETAQAIEGSVERKFGPNLAGLVNAYRYDLDNVIQSNWASEQVITYENSGGRRSTGVEFELRGSPNHWFELMGSYTVQRAARKGTGRHLANSPGQIGKARLAVPLARRRAYFSVGMQYLSRRDTIGGETTRPVALADVTLSTVRLWQGYNLVCGIRNALNWQYDHPVDLSVDRMRANGRTLFVKLIWQMGE